MIIRHAEKHNGGRERGVNIDGFHTQHELTVRGWQRAGALVRYFAPLGGMPVDRGISTPKTIFASAATPDSPSLRAQHTVRPLAELLGLAVDHSHPDGAEADVAAAVLKADGPVLIAWHHSNIPVLARKIAGKVVGCPHEWPDDRFDIVWTLDRSDDAGAPWTFTQAPQRLFAYDRDEPI